MRTADAVHYGKLHPEEMSLKNRMRCLRDLKEIGYQTGCGFHGGLAVSDHETLYEDLMFIKELAPPWWESDRHSAEGHAVCGETAGTWR